MHKASKEIRASLPDVDLLIEILDARIPFSSENPMLAELRGDKHCIKVLNKTDLADPERTKEWQDYLEQEKNVKTLATTIHAIEKYHLLPGLARKLMGREKNSEKAVTAMIVGIPNVGKSSVINILADRTVAKTGNEPAITRGQQRIHAGNGLVLLDTPGVLWGNVENRNSGFRLAATGAIKDTAMEYPEVAFFTAEFLLENYPALLKSRYELDNLPVTALELLEMVGARRGCLRSGGQVDLDKVSRLLINELRGGTLGEITLETPEVMEQELAELAVIRERKAAEKEAKKKARKQRHKKN
jgi:ribosome biogenesis GTPase A